jgi:hypothetical protein
MKMLSQVLFWLGLISVPFAWLVWCRTAICLRSVRRTTSSGSTSTAIAIENDLRGTLRSQAP